MKYDRDNLIGGMIAAGVVLLLLALVLAIIAIEIKKVAP